jgi:hypothetical protein
MNTVQFSDAAGAGSGPSHDEIAQCARELWNESGRPEGCDEAIWLDAERRLVSARLEPDLSTTLTSPRPPEGINLRPVAAPRPGYVLL